ncbi:MAG: tRNA dihydrouridine synthase DusB [Erysipelotrichaceae bacterium]|nr:tRNA dihydrouridine synthase DusB [Erysipelotrichaceae bacterium]
MLKIADLQLKNPVICAPLAGISNSAYYSLCLQQGAGLVYTEMTSSEAIHYGNKKTFAMCEIPEDTHPIALQLFGAKVSSMVEAAVYLDEHSSCDLIDINMGCPAPKVVKTGAGSALMHEPELAFAIVREIVRHVKKPVSVKMRLGYAQNERNYLPFALGLQEAGASLIAVHGRTRTQMYQGEADWEAIKEIKEALSIPVFGNGDVRSVEDYFRRKEESGVDGIMIGRALVGNPFLIREIVLAIEGKDYRKVAVEERLEALRLHAQRLCALYGEDAAMRQLRGIAPSYFKGLRGAAVFRARCSSLLKYEELEKILEEYIVSVSE